MGACVRGAVLGAVWGRVFDESAGRPLTAALPAPLGHGAPALQCFSITRIELLKKLFTPLQCNRVVFDELQHALALLRGRQQCSKGGSGGGLRRSSF